MAGTAGLNTLVPQLDDATIARYRTVYWRALLLSVLIMAIELTGSMLSGSFALRADVWHVAGDMLVAFAPLAVSYARGSRLNPDRAVRLGGAAVASVLIGIGGPLVLDARDSLVTLMPSHEVHGWLLSGFALSSAAANVWQHRYLLQVHAPHRDITHVGFHFHVRMDLLKNLALPSLGALLALNLVPQRADSWAAALIGASIALRGLVLLAVSLLGTLAPPISGE